MKRYIVAVVLLLTVCSLLRVSTSLTGAYLMGSNVNFVSHFYVISDIFVKTRGRHIWQMGKRPQVRKTMSLKYKGGKFQTLLFNSFH